MHGQNAPPTCPYHVDPHQAARHLAILPAVPASRHPEDDKLHKKPRFPVPFHLSVYPSPSAPGSSPFACRRGQTHPLALPSKHDSRTGKAKARSLLKPTVFCVPDASRDLLKLQSYGGNETMLTDGIDVDLVSALQIPFRADVVTTICRDRVNVFLFVFIQEIVVLEQRIG